MSWTDEKVKKLRELWTKGHTASEIAGLLGETTRNASFRLRRARTVKK
jgi:GcrA cell cycle regulator